MMYAIYEAFRSTANRKDRIFSRHSSEQRYRFDSPSWIALPSNGWPHRKHLVGEPFSKYRERISLVNIALPRFSMLGMRGSLCG
jgi:hypothetical protein